MADEEEEDIVDVRPSIEEDICKPKCIKAFVAYNECVERVEKDETGEAHCTGQYFDYWSCIDKCAAPRLFKQLN